MVNLHVLIVHLPPHADVSKDKLPFVTILAIHVTMEANSFQDFRVSMEQGNSFVVAQTLWIMTDASLSESTASSRRLWHTIVTDNKSALTMVLLAERLPQRPILTYADERVAFKAIIVNLKRARCRIVI